MNSKSTRRKTALPIPASRWVAYTTAGAASALGGLASSEAAVVTVNVNQTFSAPSGSTADVAYFNLTAGQSFGLAHQLTYFSSGGIAKFGIFGGGQFRGFSVGAFAYVSKLAFGAPIAGGAFATALVGTLAYGIGFANSQWKAAGTGYVGFKFTDTGGAELGWAKITTLGTAGDNVFTLNSYAYTTAGEVITAGGTTPAAPAVPEAGSLGWLALGGAGLLAWRQRRNAKAAVLPC